MKNQKTIINLSHKSDKSVSGIVQINNRFELNFKLKKSTKGRMILSVNKIGGKEIAIWPFPNYYRWDNDLDNQRAYKWIAVNSKKLFSVVSPRV